MPAARMRAGEGFQSGLGVAFIELQPNTSAHNPNAFGLFQRRLVSAGATSGSRTDWRYSVRNVLKHEISGVSACDAQRLDYKFYKSLRHCIAQKTNAPCGALFNTHPTLGPIYKALCLATRSVAAPTDADLGFSDSPSQR